MITLSLRELPTVPLEAERISPDVLAPLSNDKIRVLPVFHGKRQVQLGDFFTVDGERSDQLTIRGETGRVKWIGHAMTRGRVTIEGNAGMHLGSHMRGGEIHVRGNASDWVGAEMAGGLIHVRGNTGGQVGAAYRGGVTGMTGGLILVEGSAGLEVGMRMKRGTIAIRGKVRDFAGLQMKGGTLVMLDGSEIRAGAWMSRGTIISLTPLRLLPTFARACDYEPVFLRMYARHLRAFGFELPTAGDGGAYRRYSGDTSVPGKGEILIWQPTTA